LIVGIPFFLLFIGVARVLSLGEGRLLEAISGERMPRRPVHPGPPGSRWSRIGAMLCDARTWTTLGYFIVMLPLGIIYFTLAITSLSLAAAMVFAPFTALLHGAAWTGNHRYLGDFHSHPHWLGSPLGLAVLLVMGIALLTALLHTARGIGLLHVRLAKALLVKPGA
jgi:hypothetical protein